MGFTFLNSYVISELVASTMNFWTELSWWLKSYLNKSMLLLSWSHCYKNAMVVITIWLTARKYPYLKWEWIFYLLRRCFPSSITAKICTAFDCIYEQHGGCLIRIMYCLPFASTRVHPSFFGGGLCCSSFYFLTFWVSFCDVHYDIRMKRCSVSSLPPVVCRRTHVLFTLFVFVCCQWCPTHIVLCFCFALLRLVCPVLPVSLDCPLLFAPSVFSNVYLIIKTSASPEACIVEHPYLNNF